MNTMMYSGQRLLLLNKPAYDFVNHKTREGENPTSGTLSSFPIIVQDPGFTKSRNEPTNYNHTLTSGPPDVIVPVIL